MSCPQSSAQTLKRKHTAMVRRYAFRDHKADTATISLGHFFNKSKARSISFKWMQGQNAWHSTKNMYIYAHIYM